MSVKKARTRDRTVPRRRSILVVDDEPGTVDVLTAVLSDAGFEVIAAVHGRDALARMAGSVPDLILLDMVMPVLDGADTLRAIRADARLSRVPVVMMSGIPESMVKRRNPNYAAFLRKPFALDELLQIVRRSLERK
jgi:CheY-like chemotaxis protein